MVKSAKDKKNAAEVRVRKVNFEQKIIEKVRDRPLLYNKRHPMYKDIVAKNNAWLAIYEEIGNTEFGSSG